MENLQQQFFDDLKETCRIIVSYGSKGTGKTYAMIQMIKQFIQMKFYEEYHLVLPSFAYEHDGQYQFFKGMKNVFIYKTYHSGIGKELLNNAIKKKKRIFFGIDDSTHMSQAMKGCQHLAEIITTSRHCQICLWLCMHASKSVISKTMRANVDYMFMHRITNSAVVEDLWEEFFSTMTIFNHDKKEFYDFMAEVWKPQNGDKDKNYLFVDCRNQQIDPFSWNFGEKVQKQQRSKDDIQDNETPLEAENSKDIK